MDLQKFELSSSVSMVLAFSLVTILAILKATALRELPFTATVGFISGLETVYLGKRLAQKYGNGGKDGN